MASRKYKIVSIRKTGTRKDGWNYSGRCIICSGSKADFTGVSGVLKERALQLATDHCVKYHGGQTTL